MSSRCTVENMIFTTTTQAALNILTVLTFPMQCMHLCSATQAVRKPCEPAEEQLQWQGMLTIPGYVQYIMQEHAPLLLSSAARPGPVAHNILVTDTIGVIQAHSLCLHSATVACTVWS